MICKSYAQQDPLLTQYMFNPFVFNPAYAGSQDDLVGTIQSRYQWVGASDGISSPKTYIANAHTLLNDEKSGIGGGVMLDENIYIKQVSFNGSYSHRIIFKKTTLAMGLSVGAIHYQTNYSELNLKNEDDVAFNDGQNSSRLLPNFGTGLFYYNSRFYLGISLPRIMTNALNDSQAKLNRHYYFNGGYVLPLGTSFKLKPNVQVRYTEGAPIQLDMNLNMLIYEIIWFGFSYRSLESVDLLLELNLNKRLRLGYSYDFGYNDFSQYNSGSHEFMLGFKFVPQEKEKEKVYSPRYF